MRIGAIAENIFERIAIATGLAPVPLVESWFGFMLARTLMVATKKGIFDALAAGPLDAAAVAQRCGTDPRATEKLLRALAGARYVHLREGRFSLQKIARKWLLKDGVGSYRDKLLFQFLEWDWWEKCEDFVTSGSPIKIHEVLGDDEWGLYQRGMRAGKDGPAAELARRFPMPRGARNLLDIGGSHGVYSAAICRLHPEVHATILELPDAIKHAAPLLAKEGLGDRIVHRAGNALTDDLGAESYDLIFVASLVHHFDDATNRALLSRIARALRPNGVVAIMEVLRTEGTEEVSQMGGLLDLYFAMTSQSGTWSASEIADWQRCAGLTPLAPLRLRTMRNVALQIAKKSAP